MVRPAPQSTRQLDEAGSHEFNSSGEAISDQQMKHLKIILEMNKRKQRVLELELQLEKLCQQRFSTDQSQNVNNYSVIISTVTWNSNLSERLKFNLYKLNSCVGKAISQFKKDIKNTRNDRFRILYKEMMNKYYSEMSEISDSIHSS
ncbi:uncharacterized protein BDCG_16301 [Blastomyces dermatitidis ER-3]|uniref:Uncharacterized protein n=1 Tax=Ajellomyces dermatitidis (strain ER-3 / ATCC MYA-2586) TaxID=559297 RepID=A0ABX2VRB0_AJEDR|nr:uncharacterized protein BDCG_16301 [Blastomyces dermatitidis ER-3]OAS99764.1 hypothetical protein BDCG_16301 [Blastomyces dermatitidis ER-3]